jgi:hypothetical protein
MKKLIVIASVILFATGCNQPTHGGVSIAFEELGGEVGSRKGNERTDYRSSVSVSGLGQNQIVGSILTVPGKNIPDTYSIPIITGCSKVAVTEYGTDANASDVKKVRDYLDVLIKHNTDLVVLETEQLLLDKLIEDLKNTKEGSADNNNTKKAIFSLYSLGNKSSNEEILKELELKRKQLNSEIGKSEQAILVTKEEFNKARAKSGLIVTNWSRNLDSNGSAALGTISRVSGTKNRTRGGYLVLAGIRSASLWLGDDFAMYIAKRKDDGLTGSDSIMSEYGFIVSFSITAKYRAYSESLDYRKSMFGKLDAKISKLANLISKDYKAYLKKESIKLSKSIEDVIRSENSGFLADAKKSLYEYRFTNDKAFAQSMIESYRRSDGYLPVYSVRSNIADLKKNISNVNEHYQYECKVKEKDNIFYNYKSEKDKNESKPCTLNNCSLVDLRNAIE